MISVFVVVMVAACIYGWRASGIKSALAFIVVGIFMAGTGLGLTVKSGLTSFTQKGGSTVSEISKTRLNGK